MYKLSVGDAIYKVRFGYGVLYKSDLIDRVLNVSAGEEDASTVVKNLIGITSELLLEGLQKYHKEEFGYETDDEREKKIIEVCDLIDMYEEEHADDDKDGFTLFNDLQDELGKNGFLSKVLATAEQEAAKQNATMMPQDHKKKGGAKQSAN